MPTVVPTVHFIWSGDIIEMQCHQIRSSIFAIRQNFKNETYCLWLNPFFSKNNEIHVQCLQESLPFLQIKILNLFDLMIELPALRMLLETHLKFFFPETTIQSFINRILIPLMHLVPELGADFLIKDFFLPIVLLYSSLQGVNCYYFDLTNVFFDQSIFKENHISHIGINTQSIQSEPEYLPRFDSFMCPKIQNISDLFTRSHMHGTFYHEMYTALSNVAKDQHFIKKMQEKTDDNDQLYRMMKASFECYDIEFKPFNVVVYLKFFISCMKKVDVWWMYSVNTVSCQIMLTRIFLRILKLLFDVFPIATDPHKCIKNIAKCVVPPDVVEALNQRMFDEYPHDFSRHIFLIRENLLGRFMHAYLFEVPFYCIKERKVPFAYSSIISPASLEILLKNSELFILQNSSRHQLKQLSEIYFEKLKKSLIANLVSNPFVSSVKFVFGTWKYFKSSTNVNSFDLASYFSEKENCWWYHVPLTRSLFEEFCDEIKLLDRIRNHYCKFFDIAALRSERNKIHSPTFPIPLQQLPVSLLPPWFDTKKIFFETPESENLSPKKIEHSSQYALFS